MAEDRETTEMTGAELEAHYAALEAELAARYAARSRTPDLGWVPPEGPDELDG